MRAPTGRVAKATHRKERREALVERGLQVTQFFAGEFSDVCISPWELFLDLFNPLVS